MAPGRRRSYDANPGGMGGCPAAPRDLGSSIPVVEAFRKKWLDFHGNVLDLSVLSWSFDFVRDFEAYPAALA